VRLLFQRGNFTPHSTHIVSVALFWFAFSLPFRWPEPAVDTNVLRRSATVDTDATGWHQLIVDIVGEHRPVQAVRMPG